MAGLLKSFGYTFNLRDPRGSLDLFTPYKVLIIPSGGLMGLDDSAEFKQKLSDYVYQGGTIICFTQQYGYEFNALPGNPSGYGWLEDQSCWTNSVYINEASPIFNGQISSSLSLNVDGYFTKWPENAKILLRRNKNNMPVMLEYTYGQGRVMRSGTRIKGVQYLRVFKDLKIYHENLLDI